MKRIFNIYPGIIRSKKILLTVKSEFKPHTTSFSLRVGAHPIPSILFCLNIERHTSPSSLILGCHNFVKHFTFGGCNQIESL